MKQANEDLEKKIAKDGQRSVDIENLGEEGEGEGDTEMGDSEDVSDEDGHPKRPHKSYIEMVRF